MLDANSAVIVQDRVNRITILICVLLVKVDVIMPAIDMM